ncbi:Uncharacterised protein [Mycobacteroides abscessus subsp. abscessus]|nr:Uncharacterised protein [Mycobacteroides abscessus subsp. abscessus]
MKCAFPGNLPLPGAPLRVAPSICVSTWSINESLNPAMAAALSHRSATAATSAVDIATMAAVSGVPDLISRS